MRRLSALYVLPTAIVFYFPVSVLSNQEYKIIHLTLFEFILYYLFLFIAKVMLLNGMK